MKKIEAFQAEDGTLFLVENHCRKHERAKELSQLVDKWIDDQDENWYQGSPIETIMKQFVHDYAPVIAQVVRDYDPQQNG